MGNTALILAATKGNSALVRQLLAICRDTSHLHHANHSGQTAFDVVLQNFMHCFRQTVAIVQDEQKDSTNSAQHLCEEYSRIAWAILCKTNWSASRLPVLKKRNSKFSERRHWRRVSRSKKRRAVSALSPPKIQNRPYRRPASAPTTRRASPNVFSTPIREHLFLPQRAHSFTSWHDLTEASPQPTLSDIRKDGVNDDVLPEHSEHPDAATKEHRPEPELKVSVQQFVDYLRIIRRVVRDRHDQEQAWHAACGFVLAIAVAVRESAVARGSADNLQLVDVSAKDWTTMVSLHLRNIAPREREEALQDAEKLVKDTKKGADGQLVPAFVALANRRVAQSHAVQLFKLMVALQNHEVEHASSSSFGVPRTLISMCYTSIIAL